MRPIDKFTCYNSEKISFDADIFVRYYQPLLGLNGFALYQFLRAFPSQTGRLSELLNQLDYGMNDLESSIDKLSALKLLDIYDDHGHIHFVLYSHLTPEVFLSDPLYKQLLIDKIGHTAVDKLMLSTEVSGKKTSKKFSDVYRVSELQEPATSLSTQTGEQKLDMGAFQIAMQQQGIYYVDETKDILALYALSEKFGLDWYQLFKIAEVTQNVDHSINTANMSRRLITQNQKQPKLVDFSKAEQALIRTAKSGKPEVLLAQIKKRRFDGHPTQKERQLLARLSRDGVSDEIQNMLIIYFLEIRGYSNISDYIEEQANRWKKDKITSAELAVKWLATYQSKQAEKTKQKGQPKKTTAPVGSQTPKWYEPAYKNETSEDQQAELEKIKRDTLKKMNGGD